MRTESTSTVGHFGVAVSASPWWKAWRRSRPLPQAQTSASAALRTYGDAHAEVKQQSAAVVTAAYPHTPDEDAYLRRLRQAGL